MQEGSEYEYKCLSNTRTKFLTTGEVCHGVMRDSDTPSGIGSKTLLPYRKPAADKATQGID